MKTLLALSVAAVLAAATPLAFAQAPAAADATTAPAVTQSADPVASISWAEGPEAQVGSTIVQALLADSALAGSKVTVATDAETITLTGVTRTRDQMKRVVELVTAHAGDKRVVNAILTEEL